MKKLSFLCLFLSITLAIMAQQESDYQFIKSGYKWVEDFEIVKDCSYTGFVDSQNQPAIYGTYVDQAGRKMIGQFKDGKVNGIATFISNAYEYFGEIKNNDEANGIGRQTLIQRSYYSTDKQHVVSVFKNNQSDGLTCTTKGGAIIKDGKPIEKSLDYFPLVLYEEKLETVKSICAQNNVRYVENTSVGNFTYSGGWKNGHPYLYGAFNSRNSSRAICGVGYIGDASEQEVDVDYTKPFERWYEDYYKCYYRKLDINSAGDTTRIYQGLEAYEYSIVGKDGKYKRNDVFHFGSTDEFTKFYKYVNGHPWGIFGKNRYIQEGYLDGKEGEDPQAGKLLTTEGELHQYDNGNHYIYYPNGDKMLVHEHNARIGYMLATYTSTSGDYTIGWFVQTSLGNDNQDFYKLVEPIFARSYFSDGELKKEIVDSFHARNINNADKIKVTLLAEAPESGTAEYKFDNGSVYKGEWKNHLMDGQGTLTFSDGSYEQGTFVKGEFSAGLAVLKDGTKTWGKMINDSWIKDSVFYLNGTYEKYFIKNGERLKYIKEYYQTNTMAYDDAAYYGLTKRTNTDYHPSTVKVYEQTDEPIESNYIYEGTRYKNETKGEGKLVAPNGNYRGGTFKMVVDSWRERKYIVCDKLKSYKGSYSKGIYEGGIDNGGNPVQGKYTSNNGITFEGYFIAKSPSEIEQTAGSGTLTMADGTIVKATFGNNYTYNKAQITYANGDSYNGAMLNGMREGNGEYLFGNGDKVSSIWKKNALDQETTYTWKDGRKFVGSCKGNKPAKGIFYAADGSEVNKKEAKSWTFEIPSTTIISTPN